MDGPGQGRSPVAKKRLLLARRLLERITVCLLAITIARRAHADEQQPAQPLAPAVAGPSTGVSEFIECFRHDAALADVQFIDRSTGWAVGDRGVVWHTANGGQTWSEQESGVSCRLRGVWFIDAHRGWIVGGESRPYATASRGVVLRTDDGGATWHEVPRLVLPQLTHVKFFDANRGVALGAATAIAPSGVFVTQDAGASWQALPTDRAAGWLAGDFLDAENGAVAGAAGHFATLARRQIVHSPLAVPTLHAYRAMRLVPPAGGWLAGDGGVVMTTQDLGHSWQAPQGDLPAAREHFDFHAVAVQGSHVWVGGSPGSCVFHSPDAGRSWEMAPTGHAAPLRGLSFADSEHGWAVGEMGTILATDDGGRSWQLQRAGARRAALMCLFAGAEHVPLEIIADVGAAEGYVVAVELLYKPQTNVAAEQSVLERTHQAMLLSGAAAAETAWRFPRPPDDLALSAEEILDALNRANDGRAIEQLEKHLVRRLRMWRPDVVVTHHVASEESDPHAAVLARLLMRSVAAAADSTRHMDLASGAGLAPWQVKKIYGVLPDATRGAASIATARFTPLLGSTLADFVAQPRHLLSATHTPPPDAFELDLLMTRAAQGGPPSLFSGIALAHGSDARRPQLPLPVNDLEQLRTLATRRRHLSELLERNEGNAAWVGQVVRLTEDLKPDDGAELLVQLADGYRTTGRLDLAADTYYLLARRYPNHPLVDRSLVWLVQYYASREAGHRATLASAASLREPESLATPDLEIQQTLHIESEAIPRSASAAPAIGLSRDDRLRRAIQLTEYFESARPALFAEPPVRFAEVAAQRQLGYANPAKRYYLTLRQLPETNAWRQCAETEEWLAQPDEFPPPKRLGACRPAAEPPQLDGRLDEPFWDTADRLRLRGEDLAARAVMPAEEAQSSDGASNSGVVPANSAELRLAYDAEFLYVAMRCAKIAGVNYAADERPRPRDADLSAHDRITLRLDIDRDYATAFELSVDSRGWTNDACWGDAHWNPSWYVASASDGSSWSIEAAVPLRELVAEPPTARAAWAVAARRTIPHVGYASWAGEAAADTSPAQFGLLLFE